MDIQRQMASCENHTNVAASQGSHQGVSNLSGTGPFRILEISIA